MTKLTVVIQAGGESRRMGQDKGLAPFLGKTLVERVIARLLPAADELIITTNNPLEYKFLGFKLYSDLLQNTGALGGLYTALHAAENPLVAVAACDMPFASSKLILTARDLLVKSELDVVIPRGPNGLEPFHAVYRGSTCLPHIFAALQAQKRRVDSWFQSVRLHEMPWEEVLQIDPSGSLFLNANTPEELATAEALARGESR